MKSLIVVESCFGSTRALAEQVAAGLREGGAEAEVVSVNDAAGEVPAETDLLMLGAPTHKLGLSTPKSRQIAETQGGVAGDRGMREWLAAAVLPAGVRVVVFDTVTGHTWMSGGAGRGSRLGSRVGARLATSTQEFPGFEEDPKHLPLY